MSKRSLAAAAGLLCALAAMGQTADELIEKNIQARGGLAKLQSIQTLRLIGTMSVEDQRMPSTLEIKRPNKTRWEFTVDGETGIQAYDGKTGWVLMPFEGKTQPEEMSPEDLKDIELQADIDGPLVDYKSKGNRVELLGREKVDERDAWRLRVTLKNGESRDLYLDAGTSLQFLSVTRRTVDGREVEVESAIGDYRPVGGVLLSHLFEASVKGAPQKQTLKFDKIEVNVPIDDSRFQMPPRRSEPPRPAETPTIS
jgi:outer membrane lipoprotein-sorting protein